MIGIGGVATYLPEEQLNLIAQAAEFETNEDFLREKSGFIAVRRKAQDQESSDLCVAALDALKARTGNDFDDVDCLIVCTQNPDGHGLPHTSAIVHAKLDLGPNVAAFDISLGCSGYVYGLSVITSFMQANGLKSGLLFTADPYSKVIAEGDKATGILFGDGAAVTWIRPGPDFALGPARFATLGADGAALTIRPDRTLFMNGRAVFTFSATRVPAFISDFVAETGHDLADFDHLLMHQGSKFIIDTLRSKLGATEAQLPFMAAQTGNLVSSSIPHLLEARYTQIADKALLCGFGVGLSYAACILERC